MFIDKGRNCPVSFIECSVVVPLKKVSRTTSHLIIVLLHDTFLVLVILQRQTMKGSLAKAIDVASSRKSMFTDEELKDCFTLKEGCTCDTKDKIGSNWGEFQGAMTLKEGNFQDDVLITVASENQVDLKYVHVVTETSFDIKCENEENQLSNCNSDSFSSEDEFED